MTAENIQSDDNNVSDVIQTLYDVILDRKTLRPEKSYTTYLFEQGLDKILKKIGEEAAETIIAAKNSDDQALIGEVTDLTYHLLVLLVERGIGLDSIAVELGQRAGKTAHPKYNK